MNFVFEQIRIGGDRNFGYLVGDREARECVLIDPAYSPEVLVERAQAQQLKVIAIVNTHSHNDHINGNAKAKELTGAPVAAFHESPIFPDRPLQDNDVIDVGRYALHALHTPGHIDDHLVFIIEDTRATDERDAILGAITGDLLFVGKVGGTSTEVQAKTEWASLQRFIREAPNHVTIWPGHDYGVRPVSTLGLERATNPFLLCPDVESFVKFKAAWPEFKAKMGLK